MIKVQLIPCLEDFSFLRQTPQRSGLWGGYHFFDDNVKRNYDFTVVYQNLVRPVEIYTPKERTWLITAEPEEILTYPARYLQQFGTIITSRSDLNDCGADIIKSQQALPWLSGLVRANTDNSSSIRFAEITRDYDSYLKNWPVAKKKKISVICSNKTFVAGHRARIRFLEQLQANPHFDVDVFGAGYQFVPDKWDAIAPYEFHIVLENSRHDHYWTEKLSDCYLAGAYPIYYGAPNISEYFSENALLPIDIDDPLKSIEVISHFLKNNPYESRLNEIKNARELVLNRYNLFPMLVEYLSIAMPASVKLNKTKRVIYPISHFSDLPSKNFFSRGFSRLKKFISGVSQ